METNAKNFTMRMAVMEDAPEILAIYEPYIRKTTITFEYEVPTVEAFRQRMAGILGAYPYLVCEMDGKSRPMPMPTASRSGRPTSGTQSFPYMWMRTARGWAWEKPCIRP